MLDNMKKIYIFMFKPELETFQNVNLIFFCAVLCFGVFAGSLVSVATICGMVYGIWHIISGRIKLSLPGPVVAVGVAFAFFFVSDVIAALIYPSPIALNETIEDLPFIGLIPLFALCVADRRTLLETVEKVATGVSVTALLVYLTGMVPSYRPEFMAGNPSVLALLACILFVLTTSAAVRRMNKESRLYAVGMVASGFLIIVSGTRAAWPVLAIVPLFTLVLVVMRGVRFKFRTVVLFVSGLAIVGTIAFGVVQARIDYTLSDIERVQSSDFSGPIGERLIIYFAGYQLFQERPILGYGPGNERARVADRTFEIANRRIGYSHVHNAFLNQALRTGLMGVAALFAVLLAPLVVMLAEPKDDVGAAGIMIYAGALISYLSMGSFGILLGHDLHDSIFISLTCFTLYLVFGRGPKNVPGGEKRRGPVADLSAH